MNKSYYYIQLNKQGGPCDSKVRAECCRRLRLRLSLRTAESGSSRRQFMEASSARQEDADGRRKWLPIPRRARCSLLFKCLPECGTFGSQASTFCILSSLFRLLPPGWLARRIGLRQTGETKQNERTISTGRAAPAKAAGFATSRLAAL